MVYPAPSSSGIISANLSIAAFLVTHGAHSFMNADMKDVVEKRDLSSPFYRLFYLAVGTPLGECVESQGVFTRNWSGAGEGRLRWPRWQRDNRIVGVWESTRAGVTMKVVVLAV